MENNLQCANIGDTTCAKIKKINMFGKKKIQYNISDKKKRIIPHIFVKKVRGFTLVETLVATTILIVAITGPLFIAHKGIVVGTDTRDQLIASYLAQDAIEYVRYAITTNSNAGSSGGGVLTGPEKDLSSCLSGNVCTIDSFINTISTCVGGVCDDIVWDTSGEYYTYGTGENTGFNREISIDWNNLIGPGSNLVGGLGGGTEYRVDATVSWGKLGRSVTISENIIDWRVIFHP